METGLPCDLDDVANRLSQDGFAIVEGVLDAAEVGALVRLANDSLAEGSPGDRDALAWPWVQRVAASSAIRALVGRALSPSARATRAILFDKRASANWNLDFHQDRAVPFQARKDFSGFTGWSEKNGVPHALAPVWLLERMLAVRISLDDCDLDNGPLRVISGSHQFGLLDAAAIMEQKSKGQIACVVQAGGAVLMQSLLLHASSAAQVPRRRRVLHIEFCDAALPDGLEYYDWTS